MVNDGTELKGSGSAEIALSPSDTIEVIRKKAAAVRPAERQIRWQKMELTAFAHFGMNTFTNREWGEGAEDEKLFNPTDFDARQWMAALKEAGFTEIILTAKHHDGFCLWPSKYTEHSVKNSTWRGGKGDVVREVSDAAREAGIKFGFYLSPWDRHEETFGTPAYNDYYMNQLRELLTGYGDIAEVWMDGACGDMDPRCKNLKYDFDSIFALIRELQPGAALSIYGPDVRWVGNEGGRGRENEWSVVPASFSSTDADIGSIDKLMEAAKRGDKLRWYPAQTDTSIRPGWFYHKAEDYLVKPLESLMDIYYASVGGNSVLLLNIPPDKKGRFTSFDVKRLKQFGRAIKETFGNNLALGAAATADDTGQGAAENLTDGDYETFWAAPPGTGAASLEFDLGGEKEFNTVMLQEYIGEGQRVEEFFVDMWDGSGWKQVARGGTIGYKKLLRTEKLKASKIRVRITASRAEPVLSGFGLFMDKYRKDTEKN